MKHTGEDSQLLWTFVVAVVVGLMAFSQLRPDPRRRSRDIASPAPVAASDTVKWANEIQ